MQNFQDYLPELKSNILLHSQVVGVPFDAQRVNLDALSHFTAAKLFFNICFLSSPTWKEFAKVWKNSSRLFVADEPIKASVSPVVDSEKGESEDTRVDVDNSNSNV